MEGNIMQDQWIAPKQEQFVNLSVGECGSEDDDISITFADIFTKDELSELQISSSTPLRNPRNSPQDDIKGEAPFL